MKRSLIIGNWKMYADSVADAHILSTTIRNNVGNLSHIEIVLCPPAIWLPEVKPIIGRNAKLSLGIQNLYFEPTGGYTGEISPLMAKEFVDYAIVGHSERREYFCETNLDVNEKVASCLKAGIKPIVCVGEKKKGTAMTQPVNELKEAIEGLPRKYFKEIVVAYEPIWAVTTAASSNNADASYIVKVINKLREIVDRDTPILYGGSVRSSNVKEYAERPEIDGVLVGAASVRAAEFVKVCKIWNETKSLS